MYKFYQVLYHCKKNKIMVDFKVKLYCNLHDTYKQLSGPVEKKKCKEKR